VLGALAVEVPIGVVCGFAAVGLASAVSTTHVLAFKAGAETITAMVNANVATEIGTGVLGAEAGSAMGNEEGNTESAVVYGLSAVTAVGCVCVLSSRSSCGLSGSTCAMLLSAALGWCACKFCRGY